ncbi:MAG: zf-HC2 domain-containing protein [Lachnospiraceae bacterium]|nr:zf-HC2 domain-containing protein [Lachnospiraceae bacterium]
MKCEIIRDLLPLYADGLTSAESNQLIEEHIQACAECAALAKSMCAPLETEFMPSQDAYDCVEAIYRQKRRTKIRTVVACVLTAAIVFGGYWYYTKTHYRSIGWTEAELSQEEILEQLPELALTDAELALGRTIFGTPELQEYLKMESKEYMAIPYEQMEKYLVGVIPGDASVSEIGLFQRMLYIDYFYADMRTMLGYVDGDLTGYVDRIRKYMSVISEDRDVEAVYSVNYDVATGDADYKKSEPETHWYDFLFE